MGTVMTPRAGSNLTMLSIRRRLLAVCLLLLVVTTVARATDAIVVNARQTATVFAGKDAEESLKGWCAPWLDFLTAAGLTADTADENVLTRDNTGKLLILPNAVYLSDEQIAGLKTHLTTGGGAVLTWEFATRYVDGTWRGRALLEDMIGGQVDTMAMEEGKAAALQLRWGVPGNNALPPGYYLRTTPYSSVLRRATGDSASVSGYWAPPGLIETTLPPLNRPVGMIVRQLPTGGRLVWIGTNIDGIHIDSTNRAMSVKWAKELCGWLLGGGIAAIEPWPEGKKVGVLVHGDIEDQFTSVKKITTVFERLDLPTTFNILANEASRYPDAMAAMIATHGELGIHGDDHACFAGQNLELQLQRLNRAAGVISTNAPRPTSFRPPELAYDDNTILAVKQAGFTHILGWDTPDRDYPIYFPSGFRGPQAGLTFFPKSELDDYDLFIKVNIPQPSQQVAAMLRDFYRIKDERGLYKLNYHSQFLAHESFPATIETTLKRITSDGEVWVGTAEQIDQWMRVRENLEVAYTSTPKGVQLSVKNAGMNPVKGARLAVLPPRDVPAEMLAPQAVSQNCEYDIVGGAIVTKLPLIKPGTTFTMELGAGKGHRLSAKKKDLLVRIIRVALLLCGIFVVMFVYNIIISPRKFRKQAIANAKDAKSKAISISTADKPRKLTRLERKQQKLYRKLGIEPPTEQPAPPTPLIISSEAVEEPPTTITIRSTAGIWSNGSEFTEQKAAPSGHNLQALREIVHFKKDPEPAVRHHRKQQPLIISAATVEEEHTTIGWKPPKSSAAQPKSVTHTPPSAAETMFIERRSPARLSDEEFAQRGVQPPALPVQPMAQPLVPNAALEPSMVMPSQAPAMRQNYSPPPVPDFDAAPTPRFEPPKAAVFLSTTGSRSTATLPGTVSATASNRPRDPSAQPNRRPAAHRPAVPGGLMRNSADIVKAREAAKVAREEEWR